MTKTETADRFAVAPGWFAAMMGAGRVCRKRALPRGCLSELSDATLRDIGLHRSQIAQYHTLPGYCGN